MKDLPSHPALSLQWILAGCCQYVNEEMRLCSSLGFVFGVGDEQVDGKFIV
jgi:hypothetical protein